MLTKPETGVTEFLVQTLGPILGGRSPFVFGAILFIIAFILTNFASNAGMAALLMPVIFAFTQEMGINGAPFAASIGTLVFFATMITPAASPHAGMLHARTDLITPTEIYKYGGFAVFCILLLYIGLGLPLASILFT